MTADQQIDTWMLPESSKVTLEFQDFDFDINCQLKCTDMGYLKPIVYSAQINFGDSYLYHDNDFVSVIMHQIVEFVLSLSKTPCTLLEITSSPTWLDQCSLNS